MQNSPSMHFPRRSPDVVLLLLFTCFQRHFLYTRTHTHTQIYLSVQIYKWKSFRNYFSTYPHHQHHPFNLYFHNVSSEIIYSIWKENNLSICPSYPHFYATISSLSVFLFSVFGFINVFELTEGTPKNGLLFFIRIEIV